LLLILLVVNDVVWKSLVNINYLFFYFNTSLVVLNEAKYTETIFFCGEMTMLLPNRIDADERSVVTVVK